MPDRVVVIGAGLGGLAAALHLAGAGREVVVVERRTEPGGLAAPLDLAGYAFDAGPTVFTMPDVLARTLAAVGEPMLRLTPLEPAYRAHFADGSTLDVHPDADRMAAEVERLAGPAEAAGYLRLRAWLERLYQVEYRAFIDRAMPHPLRLVGPDLARLVALGGLRRLSTVVGRFVRDDRIRRVFSFQTLYAGLGPHEARALYGVIGYMDTIAGVWYPRGGMRALPLALAEAAEKHGVELRLGCAATGVERRGGRAVAVLTEGGRIPTEAVVVNAPRRHSRARYSPSCFLLHIGASRGYPHIAHHNIHFGTAWERTFDDIIHRGRTMVEPSLLVCNPSRTDPGLAPPGRHSYYVLAPAPNLAAGRVGPGYRDELLATLEARGYQGLTGAIEVERAVGPDDWHAAGLAYGTPFSLAHTLRQTGPFRPSFAAPGLSNVVYAGAGTHPGVGVPTVLISGRLAAERLLAR